MEDDSAFQDWDKTIQNWHYYHLDIPIKFEYWLIDINKLAFGVQVDLLQIFFLIINFIERIIILTVLKNIHLIQM